MRTIVKGFIEQEDHYYRRYSENGYRFRFDYYGFGESYAFTRFLASIPLGACDAIFYYNEDMTLLYREIYTRVRNPLPFQPADSGCVFLRTEGYRDGKLWYVEVDADTVPASQYIEDVINKTVYRIHMKGHSWDWSNVYSKTYERRHEAIHTNEGWAKITQ